MEMQNEKELLIHIGNAIKLGVRCFVNILVR